MYLSYQKQQVLSQLLATLAETQTEKDLRNRIGDPLLKLLDADYYASYVWEPEHKRFGRCVSLNMSDDTLASYDAYYRHVDGLTPLMARKHTTTLVNQVVPQAELAKTEFFNDFLQRDGLYWGLNLYMWQAQSNVGDVRIWRNRHRPAFDAQEASMLELIRPALGIALHRARSAPAAQDGASHAAPAVPACHSSQEPGYRLHHSAHPPGPGLPQTGGRQPGNACRRPESAGSRQPIRMTARMTTYYLPRQLIAIQCRANH